MQKYHKRYKSFKKHLVILYRSTHFWCRFSSSLQKTLRRFVGTKRGRPNTTRHFWYSGRFRCFTFQNLFLRLVSSHATYLTSILHITPYLRREFCKTRKCVFMRIQFRKQYDRIIFQNITLISVYFDDYFFSRLFDISVNIWNNWINRAAGTS